MRTIITFKVLGEPEPQGSTTTYVRAGKAHTTSANKNLKSWRNDVAEAAERAMRLHGAQKIAKGRAVRLELHFTFSRLSGHFGKRGLLASAPIHKTTKPDLSKLVRAIEDSLVDAGVMIDDNQVTEIGTSKHWGDYNGAAVTVIDLDVLEEAEAA